MADSYASMVDAKRRQAQAEQAARFMSTARLPLPEAQVARNAAEVDDMFDTGTSSIKAEPKPAPRPSAPAARQVAVIDDKGGYKYGQMSDGSFKILSSPRGGAGKIVRPGMKGYDAIKKHAESVRELDDLFSGDMAEMTVEEPDLAADVRTGLAPTVYEGGSGPGGRDYRDMAPTRGAY